MMNGDKMIKISEAIYTKSEKIDDSIEIKKVIDNYKNKLLKKLSWRDVKDFKEFYRRLEEYRYENGDREKLIWWMI